MRTVLALLAMLLLMIACTPEQPVRPELPPALPPSEVPAAPAPQETPITAPIEVPQRSEREATPTPSDPTDDKDDNIVEIQMTAGNWEFEPSQIRVKKGQTIRITVTSTDGSHGIAIEGYGEHVELKGKETKTLEFVADKSGTFTFSCNVYCGQGHKSMRGELIVE